MNHITVEMIVIFRVSVNTGWTYGARFMHVPDNYNTNIHVTDTREIDKHLYVNHPYKKVRMSQYTSFQ